MDEHNALLWLSHTGTGLVVFLMTRAIGWKKQIGLDNAEIENKRAKNKQTIEEAANAAIDQRWHDIVRTQDERIRNSEMQARKVAEDLINAAAVKVIETANKESQVLITEAAALVIEKARKVAEDLVNAAAVKAADILALQSVDNNQQKQIDTMKAGLIQRGFLGAKQFIVEESGRNMIADPKVSALFDSRRDELQKIRKDLAIFLGREPYDIELAFEIEKHHQDWLVSTVCPAIGKHSYECLALACIVARESM